MRPLRIVPAALLVGMGAVTCTNNAQPQAPELAAELAQAFCTHQFNCCSPAEIAEVAGGRYMTQADCLPYATLTATTELALLDSAIASGHIAIDPAAADACIAAYAGRACNTSLVAPEQILPIPDAAGALSACAGLLVGRVPNGSQCTVAEECAPGSRCTGGSSVFPTGTSTVSGMGGFGGTGSFTEPTPGGIGACIAYQGLGQPCNQSADCDPRASLYCHPPDFTCVAKAGVGESCGSDQNGNPTVECDADQGLHCGTSSRKCERFPGPGARCDFFAEFCDPDPALALSCDSFTLVCAAPGAEGDACGGAALAPCRWDLTCVPTQADGIGTCQAPPSLGQACTGPCQSPAACYGVICHALGSLPVGAPCSANEDCATLACQATFASPSPVCVASGRPIICAGSAVTPGTFGGIMTGFGGTSGKAGSFGSGFAGSIGTAGSGGVSGSIGTMTGAAGEFGGAGASGRSGAVTGGGGITDAGGMGAGGMSGAGGITDGAAGAAGMTDGAAGAAGMTDGAAGAGGITDGAPGAGGITGAAGSS